MCVTFFHNFFRDPSSFVGKIILAGEKINLAGGKIILAVGKLFWQVGKLFWQLGKLFWQVGKMFWQVGVCQHIVVLYFSVTWKYSTGW